MRAAALLTRHPQEIGTVGRQRLDAIGTGIDQRILRHRIKKLLRAAELIIDPIEFLPQRFLLSPGTVGFCHDVASFAIFMQAVWAAMPPLCKKRAETVEFFCGCRYNRGRKPIRKEPP